MKKMLWVVLVSAVAAPALCAQVTSQAEGALKQAVARRVAQVQSRVPNKANTQKQETKQEVLNQLDLVRKIAAREFDTQSFHERGESYRILDREAILMRGIVELAEVFLPYAKAGNDDVRELVYEITKPLPAGDRTFMVVELIEDFAGVRSHEWGNNDPVEILTEFSNILKQYPSMNEQEAKEYQNMRHALGRFRHIINTAKEEKPLVIMQSLVYLSDTFFDNYAKQPGKKADTFEPKNPELAASVAREIDEAIRVGWGVATIKISDYIGYHIIQADKTWKDHAPADQLDVFAKILIQASKK